MQQREQTIQDGVHIEIANVKNVKKVKKNITINSIFVQMQQSGTKTRIFSI